MTRHDVTPATSDGRGIGHGSGRVLARSERRAASLPLAWWECPAGHVWAAHAADRDVDRGGYGLIRDLEGPDAWWARYRGDGLL